MIKLVFCLRRLPHLSRPEFQRYWEERHAPLVRKNAAALRIRQYVQLHTHDDLLTQALRASRGAPQEYDGVAEVWWSSREEIERAMSSPEGQQAGRELLADEARFIDLANSPLWIAEEKLIIQKKPAHRAAAPPARAAKKAPKTTGKVQARKAAK